MSTEEQIKSLLSEVKATLPPLYDRSFSQETLLELLEILAKIKFESLLKEEKEEV
jgi:hypothetical protein